MKPDDVKNIVGFLLPTVKDMKMIREKGLFVWSFIFAVKVGAFLLVSWFLIHVCGFHAGIGK